MEGWHPARSTGGLGAAALLALAAALGTGCWSAPRAMVRVGGTALAVPVAGLSSCRTGASSALDLDPRRPLTVLVHGCNFSMGGFKTLKEGQKVSFEVTQGAKGKQASNIKSA